MKALLLLLTAGKFAKVLLSTGSMLVSLGAYALVYGWRYAAGFIAMLFVHELGHYLAARNRNLNVGLPTFLPFVGAWISLKEQPMDAETEAYIGIAGPLLGSGAAFVCYLYAEYAQSPTLLAVSYAGFMLNLFNLIPLSTLDGGRIMSAISPKLWLLGVPLLICLFIWHPSPMIIVIGLMALPRVWSVITNKEMSDSAYFQVKKVVRISYSLQYLVLVATLLVLSFEVHEQLQHRF
jgi:Zn-dependent protease